MSSVESPAIRTFGTARASGSRMRVGFLFNHYAAHQVPHAAPYAFELSRRHPEFEVLIAFSSEAERTMIAAIAALYPDHRCAVRRLSPAWWYPLIDPVVSRIAFERKNRVLKDNLDFFRSLDALVSPERHCRQLRVRYGLSRPILIHTRHGAGDREGTTDDHMLSFDFALLPGHKYVDRLERGGYLPRHAVVGYPKFDVVRALKPARPRLFDNDNPVVVYNPHFDQRVASFPKMGRQVLDFFAGNPGYNLIFAPHVVLFRRRWRHGGSLPRRYQHVPNVLIDTGSPASADMTYTLAADVYLGDVSSQVYEFLLEPRPCVFLNAHGVSWQSDPYYAHWRLGPVVCDVASQLRQALAEARECHARYLPQQRQAFAYTFYQAPGSTVAERGADAIARFLSGACGEQADGA